MKETIRYVDAEHKFGKTILQTIPYEGETTDDAMYLSFDGTDEGKLTADQIKDCVLTGCIIKLDDNTLYIPNAFIPDDSEGVYVLDLTGDMKVVPADFV